MGRRRATQADLADALGKSQPYVSRRLSGEVPFDIDDLFRLAHYFDVEVTRLLGSPYTAWFTAADPGTRDAVHTTTSVAATVAA